MRALTLLKSPRVFKRQCESTSRSGTVSAGRVQNILDEPDRVPKSQVFDHLDRLNDVLLGATKLVFVYSVEHASTSGKGQAGVGGFCRDRGNISLPLKAIKSASWL